MAKEEKTNEKKNVQVLETKIEGEDWVKAQDKAFEKKVKNVQVDGFRKGKVPRDIYNKKFGKESLFMDAAEEVLQKAYEKVMDEHKDLIPVVMPSVDLKAIDENGVTFTFKIITKPEVTVKNYKGLNISKDAVTVSEEEVQHELGHLLEKYTELVPKEGEVAEGNIAIIDFTGFLDGNEFEGGKGENYSLEIGSHTFIPGFEEQVIGMPLGSEKDINVTFPEDYMQEDLKGKEVTFKVKVNDIKEKVKRDLDKEFFEDLGMEGITDEASLVKEIEENIKAQKEMDAENNHISRLLEGVAKNVEVDIPEEMVNEELDRLMGRYEEEMKMQGITMDLYYSITKTTEEDLRNNLEKQAYENVLYRLMLEEIQQLEKIEISEEEVNARIKELSAKYNMNEEDFLKTFGGADMIKYDLEMRKVIELLKELNK